MSIEWTELSAEDTYDLVGMSSRGDTVYQIKYLVDPQNRTCTAYVEHRGEELKMLQDENGNHYYDIEKGKSLCRVHEGTLPKV